MTYSEWCENNIGYKTITTYWQDLCIAERFGHKAIRDTVDRAIKFDGDYKSLVELCMVLNHKIWFTYEKDLELGKLYDELWNKMRSYLTSTLKGEQLKYYYETTD